MRVKAAEIARQPIIRLGTIENVNAEVDKAIDKTLNEEGDD